MEKQDFDKKNRDMVDQIEKFMTDPLLTNEEKKHSALWMSMRFIMNSCVGQDEVFKLLGELYSLCEYASSPEFIQLVHEKLEERRKNIN